MLDSEAGSFEDLRSCLERGADVDLILLALTMLACAGSISGLISYAVQYPSCLSSWSLPMTIRG